MQEEDIKEIVKQLLRESLKVQVYKCYAFGEQKLSVALTLDGEVISEEFEYIEK